MFLSRLSALGGLLTYMIAVQVEWARARARKSAWWRMRVALREDDVTPEVVAGIRVYALKQADLHDRLAAFFKQKWETKAITAAQRLVALEEAAAEDEDADLESFFA
ncbi:hypothetical protein DFH06DRAFT_1338753 [Mycena polygramma]|nr:hypothetical protein DFH06DRAFT_1338753 [Mycena polygramma]